MRYNSTILQRLIISILVILLTVSCSPDTTKTELENSEQATQNDSLANKPEDGSLDTTETSETSNTSEDTDASETSNTSEEIDKIVYEPQPVPSVFKQDIAIAYQIFPIAYADSNGNGIGDLEGIISKLDYIKDELKTDMIWLNPVHPSPSYHKYDVTDYYDIDLTFGTLDDYKRLIQEAHNRDIKVLLDFVINHTSSSHPWFISAKSDVNSPYRDYYLWNTLEEDEFLSTKSWYSVTGSTEKYFASFWSEMPELNFENPKVREEIKKIAAFWLEVGVDGFRIDAARHIYDVNEYPKGTKTLEKNLEWFVEFNQFIKSEKTESFLLLENWDNYNSLGPYLNGSDSTFNFDLGVSIISAVTSENRKNIQGKLTKILAAYDKTTTEYVDSVFLSNHDQDRTLNQLGGNVDKAKLAATIEFTLPGISWIYYGEEIGMLGAKPDENIREAMKWTSDQSTAPNSRWRTWSANKKTASVEEQLLDESSVLNTYKALTQLKSEDKVLRHGSYVDYSIGTSFRLFSFFRQYENKTYFIVHNLHEESKTIQLSSDQISLVFATQKASISGNLLTLTPYSTLVIEVPDLQISAEEIK